MFEYNTIVGYSKLNRNKQVPLHEMVNYMQDCTTFHSESVGRGLQYMESIKKAWILKAYHIVQEKPIEVGQKITVGTSPSEFRGTFGERQFYIRDEAEIISCGQTVYGFYWIPNSVARFGLLKKTSSLMT